MALENESSRFFRNVGNLYPVTQLHIAKDQKIFHSANLKTRKNKESIAEEKED
jgi:hypothetical protein